MNRIDSFLRLAIEEGGSDVHLVAGSPPRIRIDGVVQPVKYRTLTPQETTELVFEIMPEGLRSELDAWGQVDFGYSIPDLSRFRVNAYLQHHGLGAAFRIVPNRIRTIEELGLSSVLATLVRRRSGFLLITGPTGSGKTTTLGAMVDLVNRERNGHIITIEQPVEFVHSDQACLVSQREVGLHAESFATAIRSALREDPDVIVLGEMRDLETISLAVSAAEMGTLVLATLHTVGAVETVDRIINVFPASDQAFIRTMLATSLSGVISQTLVRRSDGQGRVAALEILVNTPAVANLVREGKMDLLSSTIVSGGLQGMQGIDSALQRLVDERVISPSEARDHARRPELFAPRRSSS